MRIVDTSAWIEWLIDSPIAQALEPAMPSRAAWLVPTIVQLELAKWAYRSLTAEHADEVLAFSEKCVIAPLESEIAIAAAGLCRQHKLATADAIVYATAQAYGADVLTCDAHFSTLPNVIFIAKTP